MKIKTHRCAGIFAAIGSVLSAWLPAFAAELSSDGATNRPPLQPTPFVALDLGSVKARGWLENQLRLQTDGLTGNAEEVIPELGPENGWRGGNGEGWEKGPYYLRGLVSLAYVSGDPKLKKQAQVWIDSLLDTQREDGQIGPKSNNDWWPRMVITWTLRDYYEATKDPRVIPALLKYSRFMLARLPQQPLQEWAKARAGDQIDTLYWLYNRTGESFLLEVVDLLRKQANQWNSFFTSLHGSPGDFRIDHGVNVSQAMKYPVVNFERTGDPADRTVFAEAWNLLPQKHGLPIGMWSGTEALAGRSTTQGVEMCSIVEQMLSSEVAMKVLGDPLIGDQLERIAFNLLPGGTTKDFKQFQYYTLPNVPAARHGPKGELPFFDDHGDDLLVSPHSGFHCCCYNLHMGWPKYVQHSWMATSDGGIAAVAYGPTEVSAKLGGTPVTILEETDYPFGDVLRFTINPAKPTTFPFKLRIPGWSVKPRVAVNGEFISDIKTGGFLTISRTWKPGDKITAEFPAALETQNSVKGSAAIWRGPLVFSLRIGENRRSVTRIAGGFDEMDFLPTTPWNYALDIDRKDPAANVKLSRGKMPENPWLPETTPLKLTVPAKRLPGWGLVRNDRMADEVPESPASSDQPLEQVTLVPFGAQTLRITAFPLLRGEAVPDPGFAVSFEGHVAPIDAIVGKSQPSSSRGEGVPRFTFWDHTATSEWIEWNFERPEKVSSVSIYWFDDTGFGRCRVPASWRLLCRKGGKWVPISNPPECGVEQNRLNVVNFTPLETSALRIEVHLQPGFSAGLLQLTRE
ncbi:MAG: beta-L-arabinofuranosidase domain-containing protein [Luteolibacter sp.]|uniref:beta-L-arabinofuranosidase domain-containing protein n=1 Tax=Luteolibacter sp. TaxID=1962973 RepID=UPI0032655F71